MKHIESIQPEYAAGDLSRLLVSETDATASAALTALLHDWTGCAIPPTADTPQSEVEELVPLCLSILRRHWTTPLTALGDGTTPMSLADLMRRLIGDRVQGNEALGILPANADIPTAVAALLDRDMSSGLTLTLTDGTIMPLPDGLSLAQLLCGSDVTDKVTELKDSNVGWTMSKPMDWTRFPNISKVTLGFALWTVDKYETPLAKQRAITELNLPEWKEYSSYKNKSSTGYGVIWGLPIKSLYLPKFEKYDTPDNHSSSYEGLIYDCQELEEFIAPNLRYIRPLPNYTDNAMLSKCGALKKIVVGKLKMLTNYNYPSGADSFINTDCPNLIHFEIGEGSACSIRLTKWSPTTALSERLPEFLSNFKTYIAQRLTDNGSGLTLTLSPAVRDAIQQDPDIVNIITSKGWTISPAPSV